MLALRQKMALDENSSDGLSRRLYWVAALRNRQLGLWAAHTMEMQLDETESYADEIVALGLQSGGELAIVDKLTDDFARAGLEVSPAVICLEMARRTLSAEKKLSRMPDVSQAA